MLRTVSVGAKAIPRKFIRCFSSNNFNNEKVGFIGLGQMGSRMAPHLYKKEKHELYVFDVNEDAVNKIIRETDGTAKKCSSISEVSKETNVVITMLPGPNQVRDVYGQLLPAAKSGSLFIDASTIDPQTSQEVCAQAVEKGMRMADAPVSGGVGGAENGTLTFMVGTSAPQVVEDVKPYLSLMGKNIVHCGGSGMGQVAKICNNLVLGISMSAVSEAMLLGATLGMDPKILAQIFNTSSARCWSSDTYNPYPGVMEGVPSSRGYTGGFAAQLMLKDIGLAIAAGETAKSPLPLGEATQHLYKQMVDSGMGTKDFSGVLEYLKSMKKPPSSS